jgi:predicted CoA-substrate-specific enzyme activase
METFLGVDIGSIYLHTVTLDEKGRVTGSAYLPHRGDVQQSCVQSLEGINLLTVRASAVTGVGGNTLEGLGEVVNPVVCMVEGTRHLYPDVRNILYIGAGSFALIRLNEMGEYIRHTGNTACASGTGSFLDQQAFRLHFTPEELSSAAERAGRCPGVATRCAVFAKTDMIHLQQEGYTPEEIAAGLCHSMGQATVEMMLRGRTLSGRTVMIGGVAKNRRVLAAVQEKAGVPVDVPEHPELVPAIGAALHARKCNGKLPLSLERVRKKEDETVAKDLQKPLEIVRGEYPDFAYERFTIDDNETEVALPARLERGRTYDVVLGIDIGSTSTKATLVDKERNVLLIVYRYTRGDPVGAVQLVFRAILDFAEEEGITFNVLCAGTTGSGRKMVRAVLAAEFERDEITAHARAATFIDPDVDTILEIGGQDAKFTQLRGGVVCNSVMNYVCAAGTGSFIAEQAKSLGVSIWDYADFAMGIRAPRTSDRCTVFMERDLKELLGAGFSKQQAAAAVLHSVRDNYLNKVVNGLHIGEKVYFQGATARNKALIAAFEQELGKPILVSPWCHVTGAIGMCLLMLDEGIPAPTFRGLAFAQEKVETGSEICELCRNRCNLTIIRTSGETVAWGLKCGREYFEKKRKKKEGRFWELFEKRRKLLLAREENPAAAPAFRVGLPLALTAYNYLPMWRTFFAELGGEVVLSGSSTSETFLSGKAQMTAEFCAPVVLGAGHVRNLLEEEIDFLFLPHMLREELKGDFADCHFCCYVQGFPTVMKAMEAVRHRGNLPVVSPCIQLGYRTRRIARELHRSLSGVVDASPRRVRRAFARALAVQRRFEATCRSLGEERIQELNASGEMGIVVLGRPYNLNDAVLNLELPQKIGEKGISVIPLDCLPGDVRELDPEWQGMYWNYGQKILRAAETIRDNPNLFGVFFTNFACGPDSYILTYFKEIMAEVGKPYLVLQFDGHGADAGYLTRVEAAVESFRAWSAPAERNVRQGCSRRMSQDRTVLIPNMDPVSVRFFAAGFERFGYRAIVLEDTDESLAEGYKHTLGGECVPCPATIGGTLATMEKHGLKPSEVALFMPGASGPCRFGQYSRLDEILFEKRGWSEMIVLSPSADNAYQGLSQDLRKLLWDTMLAGDIVQKAVFKLRPYEVNRGEVDRCAEACIRETATAFADPGGDPLEVFAAYMGRLADVEVAPRPKPKIGVVGEIYVRNNRFLLQDLFRFIENLGGEVLKTSIAEWIEYTTYLARRIDRGGLHGFRERIGAYINNWFLDGVARKWYGRAGPVVADRKDPHMEEIVELGRRYVPLEFEGEAILTIGRALHFIQKEGVDAIINASPTFCMPGTITTAVFARIEEELGVPCICLFYDGSGDPNSEVVPHMHFLCQRIEGERRRRELSVRE